jgi:hypothetical protein
MEDDSSSSDASIFSQESSSGAVADEGENEERSVEANSEMQGAVRSSWLVIGLLIVASLAVCFPVAFLSLRGQEVSFEQAFEDDAGKLFDHIGSRVHQNLDAVSSFGTSITSYTTSMEGFDHAARSWPFVTVPNFPLQGAQVKDMLNTSSISICPVVTGEDREAWETYSSNEGDDKVSPFIYEILNEGGERVIDVGPSPFYPLWQMAPASTPDVKFNLRSLPSVAKAMDHVVDTGKWVITSPLSDQEELEAIKDLGVFSLEDAQEHEPIALLLSPVFSSFAPNRQVVAVTVAPFLWKSYMFNTYGRGTRGITAVFKNPCGPSFTYELDEDDVVFIGNHDIHTKYYEHLKKTAEVSALLEKAGYDDSIEGFSLGDEYECQYSVSAFPSAVYMNQHTTNGAVVVTTTAVVIFGFVFLLFLCYGVFTEHRLESLNAKASRTQKLVNTLFPKEVQERMFRNSIERDTLLEKERIDDPLANIKTILKDTEEKKEDLPIANLYTDCTVMFADLTGFTAWSACREPGRYHVPRRYSPPHIALVVSYPTSSFLFRAQSPYFSFWKSCTLLSTRPQSVDLCSKLKLCEFS